MENDNEPPKVLSVFDVKRKLISMTFDEPVIGYDLSDFVFELLDQPLTVKSITPVTIYNPIQIDIGVDKKIKGDSGQGLKITYDALLAKYY